MKETLFGAIKAYQFDLLKQFSGVSHAVFTRHGGTSSPPFHTLNLSFHTGDNPIHVESNRETVRRSIGAEHLISAVQVHETRVKVIDRLPVPADELEGVDALVTSLPGVVLLIKQADCQAVLLFDPQRKAIANIHCGWRGNVSDIVGHTVRFMSQTLGTRPGDLVACIGPSLGPCCAEFKNFRQEFPPDLWRYEVAPEHFDLWAATRDQLCAAGISEGNIEMAEMCTKCRTDEFFSYRGEGKTGRFGTAIALRNGVS